MLSQRNSLLKMAAMGIYSHLLFAHITVPHTLESAFHSTAQELSFSLFLGTVSVWGVVEVSSAWLASTNQISTAEIPQCSKILYYIHQTLPLLVLMVWEWD